MRLYGELAEWWPLVGDPATEYAVEAGIYADLRRAMETAWVHCRPGGAVLFAPDYVRENFPGALTDDGGCDEPPLPGAAGMCARGLRYVEWVWDPDPGDTHYFVDYAFLLRDRDGSARVDHDVPAISKASTLGVGGKTPHHTENRVDRAALDWVDLINVRGFVNPKQYGCRIASAGDDNPVALRRVDDFLDVLLRVSHRDRLHRISSVIACGGFRRTARTPPTAPPPGRRHAGRAPARAARP